MSEVVLLVALLLLVMCIPSAVLSLLIWMSQRRWALRRLKVEVRDLARCERCQGTGTAIEKNIDHTTGNTAAWTTRCPDCCGAGWVEA